MSKEAEHWRLKYIAERDKNQHNVEKQKVYFKPESQNRVDLRHPHEEFENHFRLLKDGLEQEPYANEVKDIFIAKFDSAGQCKGIKISKTEQGFYSITDFTCCGDTETDCFMYVDPTILKNLGFAFSTPG